jgi:predicted metal-dependent phosphoesterase TrpH
VSWSFVVHVHTRRSFDSMTPAAAIVDRAVSLGIHALAITDHDTWQGSVDALDHVSKRNLPLRIVIASEVASEQGDLIGLFLRDDVRQRSGPDFCDEVHEQGGLVLLPHPAKWHRLDEKLLERIDLVEIFNGRTTREGNAWAAALAHERKLPGLVGPDAHRLGELELARNEFEGEPPGDEAGLKRALLTAPRTFHTRAGSIWNEWRSQGVRLMKRPDARLAYYWARGALRRIVKPAEYRLE